MKILCVVGARPNFMKMAPILKEMKKYPDLNPILLHTGQHYDDVMSRVFFVDLGLPRPDIYLGIGGGSHAEQTARIMLEFDKILLAEKPDSILVVGDVNSTLACSLVAAKSGIKIAHVEAGLRSGDRTMPEEINRILTDALSDLLLIPSLDARENLLKEGIPDYKIHFVGNVMVDCLRQHQQKATESTILKTLDLESKSYVLLTLHRPSNVDDISSFKSILDALCIIQKKLPIIFPVHPRTRQKLAESSLQNDIARCPNIRFTSPLGYLDFLNLMMNARLVLTDSGGIQEETTALSVPCLTLRNNTERPITIWEGTNVLVGTETQKIIEESLQILNNSHHASSCCPQFWDGLASERIVSILRKQESFEKNNILVNA